MMTTRSLLVFFLTITALFFSTPVVGKETSLRHGRRQQLDNSSSSSQPKPEKAGSANFQTRIVGGTDANAGDYPFYTKWASCGASLVAPDVLLSAAHCGKITSNTVHIGRSAKNGDDDAIERTITQRLFHPDYLGGKVYNYDIMLLQLNEPVTSVTPISLNSDVHTPYDRQELTVVGFGALEEGGRVAPDFLQEANVKYVDTQRCNSADSYNGVIRDPYMLCAGEVPGKNSCNGDSGGPIFTVSDDGSTQQFTQVGITSWHEGCNNDQHPGVYARVSHEIQWMKEGICQLSRNENKPDWCNNNSLVDDDSSARENTVDVTLRITYDDYPNQTGWYFQQDRRTVLERREKSYKDASDVSPGGTYSLTVPLVPGETATFTITDKMDNGNCCRFGEGRVELYGPNDELLLSESGDFKSTRTTEFFVPYDEDSSTLEELAPPVNEEWSEMGFGCFSGSTLVHRQGSAASEVAAAAEWVPLSKVQIGDLIEVDSSGTFEPIYAFGHYQPDAKGSFIELHFDANYRKLQITKEHLIWTPLHGAVPAGSLQVGDQVVLAAAGTTTITLIEQKITSKGIYAPFTTSGTLVLNHGLLASSYISLDPYTTTSRLIPRVYHHALAHFFTTPHRFWCSSTVTGCRNPTYNDDGINVWEVQLLFWIQQIAVVLLLCLVVVGVVFLFCVSRQSLSWKKL
mmetsp:Transcript_16527/g.24382  ORF Transcript_16527/g.24382 Transcript_16527/m.24382 type:complete len:685 (-) Transcript_16527:28-2082(-)